MKPEAANALAKIAGILGDQRSARVQVWEGLSPGQRQAIMTVAGVYVPGADTARLRGAPFEECWHVLSKLARLAGRIEAAERAMIRDYEARITALRVEAEAEAAGSEERAA